MKETLQAAARRLRMHSCKGWSPRWDDVPDNQLPREATDLQQLVPMAVGLCSVDLQTAIPAEGGLIPRVICWSEQAEDGKGHHKAWLMLTKVVHALDEDAQIIPRSVLETQVSRMKELLDEAMQTIWADKLNEPRAWMAGAACWATGSCCDHSRACGRPVAVVADQHYAETARMRHSQLGVEAKLRANFLDPGKGASRTCWSGAERKQKCQRTIPLASSHLKHTHGCWRGSCAVWKHAKQPNCCESRTWGDVDWVGEVSERHAVGCSIFDCRRIEIDAPKQSHWEMFRTLDRPI